VIQSCACTNATPATSSANIYKSCRSSTTSLVYKVAREMSGHDFAPLRREHRNVCQPQRGRKVAAPGSTT
jgi:hypothetical protein